MRRFPMICLPELHPGSPIEVDGKVYTIESIRISGIDIYLKVKGMVDMFLFHEGHMKVNYKEY